MANQTNAQNGHHNSSETTRTYTQLSSSNHAFGGSQTWSGFSLNSNQQVSSISNNLVLPSVSNQQVSSNNLVLPSVPYQQISFTGLTPNALSNNLALSNQQSPESMAVNMYTPAPLSNEQTPGPGHRGSNAVSGLNMSPTFSPQDDLLDGVLNEIPDNDHSFNGHHLNNNNNNNNPFFQSNVTEYRITKLEKQVETLTQLVALMSRNQAAEQNDNQLTEFMRQNNINDAELDAMTKNSSTYKEAIRRLMAKILQDEEWLNCSVLGQGTKRPGLPSKKLEIIYKYIGRHFGKTTKRMIHDWIRDHLKNTKRKLENGDGDGDENENQ